MNDRVIVQDDRVPKPIGPYNQAVKCHPMVFLSGQLGIDPKTGELVSADAAGQARRALQSIQAILDACATGTGRVVKTTIFLIDLADFAAVNKVYEEFFAFEPPARTTVQVAALPKGARVEIEAIAMLPPAKAASASMF